MDMSPRYLSRSSSYFIALHNDLHAEYKSDFASPTNIGIRKCGAETGVIVRHFTPYKNNLSPHAGAPFPVKVVAVMF